MRTGAAGARRPEARRKLSLCPSAHSYSSPGTLGNYLSPVFASASEAALESLSTASSKRDLRLGVAPRSAQNGNFVLSRTGPAAPWTLTLLLPADWKRLHRRPGWERGPSVPRGLQTGLGCKLSEKREGGGHGRPELGGPSAGRLPPGLACLSFQCGGWR